MSFLNKFKKEFEGLNIGDRLQAAQQGGQQGELRWGNAAWDKAYTRLDQDPELTATLPRRPHRRRTSRTGMTSRRRLHTARTRTSTRRLPRRTLTIRVSMVNGPQHPSFVRK